MHNITIRRVTNGVVVEIGCHTFVHNDIAFAMKEVADYLYSPAAAKKKWELTLNTWYKFQLDSEEPDAPAPEHTDSDVAYEAAARGAMEANAPFYRGETTSHMETPAEREPADAARAHPTGRR